MLWSYGRHRLKPCSSWVLAEQLWRPRPSSSFSGYSLPSVPWSSVCPVVELLEEYRPTPNTQLWVHTERQMLGGVTCPWPRACPPLPATWRSAGRSQLSSSAPTQRVCRDAAGGLLSAHLHPLCGCVPGARRWLLVLSKASQACKEELQLERLSVSAAEQWEYNPAVCRMKFLERACGANP